MTRAAASWVDHPLVVAVDGPLGSRWYFEDDWRRKVAAGRYLVERGQAGSVYLEYELTDRRVDHPREKTTGRVLRWRGSGGVGAR